MNRTLRLTIDGMHCGGCVARVTKALGGIDGVAVQRVEVGSAELAYDEAKAQPAAIAAAVDKLGFTAREA